MRMPRQSALRLSLLFSALGVLLTITAGCSLLPEAKSDPTRFYVLSTSSTGVAAVTAPNAPTVQLHPIELTSYLRARPLIVRRGENEIEFREFARWGESLDVGVARVLREDLLGRGAASVLPVSGIRREHAGHDYTLTVRVLACEGAVDGRVLFRAVWELARTKGEARPATAARGDFRPAELRWDGKTEASLAAQLSLAVTGLAAEIAEALKK